MWEPGELELACKREAGHPPRTVGDERRSYRLTLVWMVVALKVEKALQIRVLARTPHSNLL